MAHGTSEKDFEAHIETYLHKQEGYWSLSPESYDPDLCLVPNQLIAFIQESQPEAYKQLCTQLGSSVNERIVQHTAQRIQQFHTLETLRRGFKINGVKLEMVYFKPAHHKTPEHAQAYQQNRLGVMRQMRYSKRTANEIDMVFFINGIPVATAELKNALTGQNHHNAIKQYMQDRDPKGEKFLEFKRCLVHFAVGTEKVFMTTELKGKHTWFLPFNQGLENYDPADFAVSYLWKDVLRKDSLLELVQHFISVQSDTSQFYNAKTRQLDHQTTTRLLFPRFHQRRAVLRVLDQLHTDGTGHNYLIQHSAGSGKSNTITWLAYRLANFYRYPTDEKALYDSVIVVTDRRVLNKQLQDNIRQLDNTPGVVAYIDEKATSKELKQAIEERKRIIVTTLQKFPVISESITAFPDRTYAILIDEAHSSQSGEAARHMRKALSLEEAEKEEATEPDLDDIITAEIARKGKRTNITQIAFTATPKDKTLELFGTLRNGQLSALDEYTMEEAIREGFILDVLKNYMSFKRYYKLVKRSDSEDKEFEKKKTIRVLNSYVDLQDYAIDKKTRIMVEHFASQTHQEIQGKARGMLVTRSRLHAVRYKLKFDEVMQEMLLPYRALVAFSGSVHDPETGLEYTEISMNNLKGKLSIPEAFKLPEYRILIVANKYQTGFDEPLLHTMFVDKKLGGTSTVQTLSRLNRTTRGKDTTMVLDFVNDPDDVRADFQKYYGKNYMDEADQTDPNSLYILLTNIENYHVYFEHEVDEFARIFFVKKDNYELLQPLLQNVSKRFVDTLTEDEQVDFKAQAKSFVKVYRFLSQIITFRDPELEKKYVFLTALIKKLPYVASGLPLDVLNDIELDSFKIQHQFTTDLELTSGDGKGEGMKPGGKARKETEELDLLTRIIQVLNDTFGLELTEDDKVAVERIKDNLYSNQELMLFFNQHNSKDNIQDRFNTEIDEELLNFINTKLEFYKKMTDERVNKLLKNVWFNELYDLHVRQGKRL